MLPKGLLSKALLLYGLHDMGMIYLPVLMKGIWLKHKQEKILSYIFFYTFFGMISFFSILFIIMFFSIRWLFWYNRNRCVFKLLLEKSRKLILLPYRSRCMYTGVYVKEWVCFASFYPIPTVRKSKFFYLKKKSGLLKFFKTAILAWPLSECWQDVWI